MPNSLRWTDQMHEAWKAKQASFTPSHKSVVPAHATPEPATAAQEHGRTIPVLTDAVANPELSEAQIQKDVLEAVKAHTSVAWAIRVNSGAIKKGKHLVRFGAKGMPDIIGQLFDGRFLGVEVKRHKKNPTEEQVEFIAKINQYGGTAFVARCVQDVVAGLGAI
jgi:hypothetical protein